MDHNWSWLPARRVTTPPPPRPNSGDFGEVDVLPESDGGYDRAMSQHFLRSFPHDNVENSDADHFVPVEFNSEVADFDRTEADMDDDSDDIDNDEVGDENVDDAEVTGDEEVGEEEDIGEEDPPFDPASVGLKEISNLASFTVSSYKPGCGVQALRDDDPHMFWQ